MNVREIVCDWLKAHGMDGLAADDCGCGIDDLAPCGDIGTNDCVGARKCKCDQGSGDDNPPGCDADCADCSQEIYLGAAPAPDQRDVRIAELEAVAMKESRLTAEAYTLLDDATDVLVNRPRHVPGCACATCENTRGLAERIAAWLAKAGK